MWQHMIGVSNERGVHIAGRGHRTETRRVNQWPTVKVVIWTGGAGRWSASGNPRITKPSTTIRRDSAGQRRRRPIYEVLSAFGTSYDGQDELHIHSLVEPTRKAAPDVRTLARLLHQRTGLVVEVRAPTTQTGYRTEYLGSSGGHPWAGNAARSVPVTVGGGTLWREPPAPEDELHSEGREGDATSTHPKLAPIPFHRLIDLLHRHRFSRRLRLSRHQ